MNEVYIVSAKRTPIGSFGGSLATVGTTRLGATAIKSAVEAAGIKPDDVQEVIMGCVLTANLGQAPARQAAKFAGLPDSVICTTVNKVCASGMKAITLAAQSIMLGHADVILAGGMENMSLAPYYLEQARTGYRLGHGTVTDAILKDGLTDVYSQTHMGISGELCARECSITRNDQDEYAIESYKRAAAAWESGAFKQEIAAVEIQFKGETKSITEDEEYRNVKFEKIPQLKPVFQKDGTITAANASTLNDGASALVLMSRQKAESLGLKPLARIVSFADAEQAPEWFTTTPAKAIPKALKMAGKNIGDVDYFEINEAFSVVSIANNRELKLDPAKVNIHGGAVSLGHPIGSSGSRIVVSLIHILHQKNAGTGVAGICNGGGGATAIVIERM
jgi:acetyl-CoA C-acetyltransferase